MILLIDSGNTALKYASLKNGQISEMSRIMRPNDCISEPLECLLSTLEGAHIKSVYISNVAGKAIEKQLTQWCQKTFQIAPHYAFVSKGFSGLVNAYSPVENLGIDRWLALIAATDCFQKPICVADIGTAVTIDSIDETNKYIGGVILPGLMVMRQSLQQNADAITTLQEQKIDSYFATNTQQGVHAGTVLAIAASVDKMIEKLQQQTNEAVTCVLSGGDANQIKPFLSGSIQHVPDLVLKGLYLWGKENALDR